MITPASEDSPEPWSREPDALLLPVMEQLALPLNCLDNEAAFGSLTGFLSFRLQQGLAIKEVQFSSRYWGSSGEKSRMEAKRTQRKTIRPPRFPKFEKTGSIVSSGISFQRNLEI